MNVSLKKKVRLDRCRSFPQKTSRSMVVRGSAKRIFDLAAIVHHGAITKMPQCFDVAGTKRMRKTTALEFIPELALAARAQLNFIEQKTRP